MEFAFISQVLSTIVYGTLKLSVLFLYRRLFHSEKFEIISLSAIALIIVWCVAFVFASLFQCGNNPSWLWAGTNAAMEHCGPYKHIQLGQAVSDVVTGLLVLIIPVPIVWKLHMSLAQKTGMMIVFLLGYLYVEELSPLLNLPLDSLLMQTLGLLRRLVSVLLFSSMAITVRSYNCFKKESY